MAAERLAGAGLTVRVFERMPTPARKLLLAGRGGLNLTHSEPLHAFLDRYGARRRIIAGWLERFGPEDLRAWAAGLGVETFVGTSGRVFPVQMKASTLVRAWLRRLAGMGVTLHTRHRWLGWSEDGTLRFLDGAGAAVSVHARAAVLAAGGASWPRTGSDGTWTDILAARGVAVEPLRPANVGFEVPWSDHLRERFAGQPVKPAALTLGGRRVKGEFVITDTGVEGGAVYALSAPLRDAVERDGWAALGLDLLPDLEAAEVRRRTARRGAESLATFLKKAFALTGPRAALLREFATRDELADPAALALRLKELTIPVTGVRPLDRAISSAGGVRFDAVDERLMLTALPGTFVAGEMLDWEAPTGGYLLQACFAGGVRAAEGVAEWLADGNRQGEQRS
nr:TIGR03862 family flavoprotein [Azospirillum halopraeferens]